MAIRSIALLALWASAGLAQPEAGVLFRQSFQTDTAGWAVMGTDASVRVTTDSGREKGRSALAYNYELGAKKNSGLVLPVPKDFAQMRRIRFTVKSDHDAAVAVLLSEKKPGGNYSAWFWAPADIWQTIELTPADFTVSDDPKDPVDPDGKLDVDAVEGIGIFDMAQFFAALSSSPNLPIAVNIPAGAHTLLIDSFEVLSSAGETKPLLLTSMDRNFLDWVTPGGMDLKLAGASNPLHMPAMQASYRQAEDQLQLLVRRVSGAQLAHAKRLAFDIASEHDVTLVVSLEMRKQGGGAGPRFTLPIFPPGGKEVFHVDVALSDFKGDGTFDPAQWRTMTIIDVTVAGGGAPTPNTLWIGNLQALE
jgi:hypothetical protein